MLSALAALKEIKPAGSLEAMLVVQMIATHHAAMECFTKASGQNLPFRASDFYFRYAGKFLTLFAKQMETLNRNRGKGQQKVTVEHVHVQSGGQAIVGNVEHGSK
jgi:phosphopantetheinyl transferase (holo-ACP synthase)